MAIKWPLANGNWSNAANWNDGTLPDVGDDVHADGKTVTIDQDVTVASIRNDQRSGGTANGGFNFSNVQTTYNIVADLIGFNATLINVNQGSRTYNFTGNVDLLAGATSTVYTINITTTQNTVNIVGNINSVGQASNRVSVNSNQINTIINITGNVSGGSNLGGLTAAGLRLVATNTNTVTITGNVTSNGSNTGSATGGGHHGIILTNANNNIIDIYGNVLTNVANNGGSAIGASSGCVGNVLNIYGNVVGKNSFSQFLSAISWEPTGANDIFIQRAIGSDNGTGVAIYSAGISDVVIETLEYSTIGTYPALGVIKFTPTNFTLIGNNQNNNRVIYTDSNNVENFTPIEEDVRQGTTYLDGIKVGTLAVPDPSDVRKSVPTDNTVGTAELTGEDILQALNDSTLPLAVRLKNVATVQSTGDQITSI